MSINKRLLAVALGLSLLMSLAACSNQTSPPDDPTPPVTSADPGSEQDTTGSTLYIGFYLPELKMADLTNCNAASYIQWTFQLTGTDTCCSGLLCAWLPP